MLPVIQDIPVPTAHANIDEHFFARLIADYVGQDFPGMEDSVAL